MQSRGLAFRRKKRVRRSSTRRIGAAKAWLFGGNTVARVGLLVLFVGVAFLLRYVAERTQIPIELRLVGVALGAVALLVVGWRLRHKRPGYAITLQGGAIGILYLTVFAAMRLYDVLPPVPAFALLAALAAFSGVLAIAQNARALAALGATGGFLAPILVSTGSGRIEVLLSFYLLLNLGVLGIAWFRAWRELNWIGFAFTFGVLGTWVAQRYTRRSIPGRTGILDRVLVAVFGRVAVVCAPTTARETRHLRYDADVRVAAGRVRNPVATDQTACNWHSLQRWPPPRIW